MSTHRWTLLEELGLYPVQCHLAILCARFWNRSNSVLTPGFIGKSLMMSDVNLFKAGCDTCWSAKFLTCMCRLGLTEGKRISMLKLLGSRDVLGLRFPEEEVKKALFTVYQSLRPGEWSDPRTAPSRGAMWVKYKCWFENPRRRHLLFSGPDCCIRGLIKLRVGSTNLKIYDHSIPREKRVCELCQSGEVEDELHVLRVCPAYSHVRRRDKWAHLFVGTIRKNLKEFMDTEDQFSLAMFVNALFKERLVLLHALTTPGRAAMVNTDLPDYSTTDKDGDSYRWF